MDSVELVKKICKERKIPISKLERDCDFANGYIRKLKEGKFPSDRLKIIADYLDLPVEYLMTGEIPDPAAAPAEEMERFIEQKARELVEEHYYFNDETREIVEQLFSNPELRILFDASRKLRPEDLKFLIDMAKRMRNE